jgi:hypothetical protein
MSTDPGSEVDAIRAVLLRPSLHSQSLTGLDLGTEAVHGHWVETILQKRGITIVGCAE